jgi:hypothetical protein
VHPLSLVILYARTGSPKFEPAAVRWVARLALEGREVQLNELRLAAAALACLRGSATRTSGRRRYSGCSNRKARVAGG